MEIDSAVEEVAAPRQRSANRAAAAGRSQQAPTDDASSSTAVAELPPVPELPRRETPAASQPTAPVSQASPASTTESIPEIPPTEIQPSEPESTSEPIVTETFLKPKEEKPLLPKPALPTPELPETDSEPTQESPPAFPETFAAQTSEVPDFDAPPAHEPTPVPEDAPESFDPESGHDLSTFDLPHLPTDDEPPQPELSGPPALQKTQPIRTVERSSDLPPLHSESQAGSGDLPRLDVSLAGEAGSVSNPGPVSENVAGQGKTKLRLPQPGEEAKRFTPADFIAPEAERAPAELDSADAPVEEGPGAAPEVTDPEESYRIVGSDELNPEAVAAPASLDSLDADDEPEIPSFDPVEERSLDDLEVEEEPPTVEEESPAVSQWDPLAAPERLPDDDPVEGDLDEGSFGKLFAQQSGSQSTSESIPREASSDVEPEAVGQPNVVPSFSPSHGQPGSPQNPDRQVQPVVRKESQSDSDVLEEMFGTSKSSSFRPKKSTLIMLGVVGLLATIAIVIVMVAGSALGFWGDSPTTMDPVTQAPESMKPKEPAPELEETPSSSGGNDVPAAITPGETGNSEIEEVGAGEEAVSSTLSLPGDTEKPVLIVDSSAPANPGAPPSNLQESSESVVGNVAPAAPAPPAAPTDEPEALSFDERVQNIVNGNGLNPEATPPMPDTSSSSPPATTPDTFAAGTTSPASATSQVENYNPPESFPAPGPDDGPLGKTHDLIDAYLRAPDWETRSKYVYQGESLKPAMEEYYKKWPDRRLDRYSHQLYAMESDVEFGGPYWVYLISQSDDDQGYPFIIRVEDGNLKVDWESHSEFFDQHWVKFQQGGIAVPHTFRVAIERVSDYYGPDRDQFENLGDYFVYKINPPYGGDDEFMEYAFVKKDSELAARLDEDAGLGEEALAVMLTLDHEQFPHGEKHLVVRDYVSEGWFR